MALHLAGSFLETYRDDPLLGHPADLLAELRDTRLLQHLALLGEDVTPSPTNHVLHVGKTFAVSYDRLQPDEPVDAVSVALLARSAWFAAGEPIPRDLLLATFPVPPDDRAAARQAAQGLLRLHALGLLEVIDAGALRLHRLLAAFVQGVSDDAAAQTAVEEAVLTEAERLNHAGDPRPLLAWQPHLRAITDGTQDRGDARAGALCNELGYHLRMIGDYAGTRPY